MIQFRRLTAVLAVIGSLVFGGILLVKSPVRADMSSNAAAVETAVVPPDLFDELTAREREILELIAQGKTNSEIAASLSLSPKTINNYISNVLLKVQATDRAKLMLMALDAGLGQTGKNAL